MKNIFLTFASDHAKKIPSLRSEVFCSLPIALSFEFFRYNAPPFAEFMFPKSESTFPADALTYTFAPKKLSPSRQPLMANYGSATTNPFYPSKLHICKIRAK